MNEAARTPAERLVAARQRVRVGLREGTPGGELSAAFADDVAGIVASVAAPALADAPDRVALAAIGALGRRELSPFSDLDLVLVAPAGSDAALEDVVRRIVHPLWDAGLRPNLVVHELAAWA